LLGAFVTTAQQKHKLSCMFAKINPQTGAKVDFQLTDTIANMPVVSEIPQTDSCQSNSHCGPHLFIKERMVPIVEWNAAIFELEFLDVALYHHFIVIYSSQMSTGVLFGAESRQRKALWLCNMQR
jgi:hypothetical protein